MKNQKLQLSHKIRLNITDGEETLIDVEVLSKRLKKKEQREISEIVAEAQKTVKEDPLDALSEIEEAAKLRFERQITGTAKDIKELKDFGEDYGFTLLIQQVDDAVAFAQGKQ